MKTKVLLLILFISCTAFFAAAQVTFQKRYGTPSAYEQSYHCTQTSDGGYVIIGSVTAGSASENDVYMIKIDSAGVMQWNKVFSRPAEDRGFDIAQTPDNGYIITGFSGDTAESTYDVLLLKTDAQGNLSWVKTYGGPWHDEGKSVKPTYDGGFIIAGYTQNFISHTLEYAYLIKTDSSGNILWDHSYGDAGRPATVIQTKDSGFVFAGSTYDTTDMWDGQLIKTDNNGSFLWSKKYGGIGIEHITDAKQTSDGGFIATGTRDSVNGSGISIDLLRMDSLGNLLWVKNFDNNSTDWPYSVNQTSGGGYIISGVTTSFDLQGLSDMVLIKTSDSGSIEWAKIYGGSESSISEYAQQAADNGYFLGGTLVLPNYNYEVLFVKTDSLGNTYCNDSTVTFTETSQTLVTAVVTPPGYSGGMTYATTCDVTAGGVEYIYCSSTAAVEISEMNFQIFPNPVTENFTINFDEPQEHLEIKIFNSMGDLVHIEKNLRGNEFRIRLPDFADGIYVVQLTNSRDLFSRKIIVVND